MGAIDLASTCRHACRDRHNGRYTCMYAGAAHIKSKNVQWKPSLEASGSLTTVGQCACAAGIAINQVCTAAANYTSSSLSIATAKEILPAKETGIGPLSQHGYNILFSGSFLAPLVWVNSAYIFITQQ